LRSVKGVRARAPRTWFLRNKISLRGQNRPCRVVGPFNPIVGILCQAERTVASLLTQVVTTEWSPTGRSFAFRGLPGVEMMSPDGCVSVIGRHCETGIAFFDFGDSLGKLRGGLELGHQFIVNDYGPNATGSERLYLLLIDSG